MNACELLLVLVLGYTGLPQFVDCASAHMSLSSSRLYDFAITGALHYVAENMQDHDQSSENVGLD